MTKMKKPIIVNLCGAPGAGKSTGAAYIFSKLKMAGVNAELVTEFAKDKVWEETHAVFENQMYMFAKQWFRITRCESKVDVIVTDSPIILSLIYKTDERLGKEFDDLVLKIFNTYNNMNYFLKRVKAYNPVGRFQTEEESDALSIKIKNVFLSNGVKLADTDGDTTGYDKIFLDVINKLAELKEENKKEKNKYTVCLYDGSVTNIEHIVATKIVEADDIDSFDHIALFYDLIENNKDYKVYENRITKGDFKVYYERTICLSDTIHTYDFGSYTRFIAVFEGEYKEKELPEILQDLHGINK